MSAPNTGPILFHTETEWPLDRKRKKGEKHLDGIDWMRVRHMPMVPRVGDMLAFGEHDDYRRVDQVFIRVEREGYLTVEVFLVPAEGAVCTQAGMIAAGWTEAG